MHNKTGNHFSLPWKTKLKKAHATYSEVELYPGTSLNLIIGPNGTGKSTFVSAIILGLCGKPHIIGRTNKVSDYIRSGSDKAVIEIELYQSPGKRNIIIRRTIVGELSKWYIDNKEVEERIVKELILKFKIQVDNLCQLLPQDKVHDFSKLNPQELLKSTLSAIDTESLDQLKTLIDNCKEKHDLKMRLTYIDNQLKKLQRENEGLKGNYEAMLERNEYEKEIKICKLKELWIEFNSLSLEINTYKEDKRSKENVLKSLESKLKKIEDDVKVHSDNMKRMNNERNNLTAIINELKNTTNLNINSIKSNEDEIRKAELTYEGILVRESNRGKAIETEKVKLEKLKNDKTIFEKKKGNESELKKSLDNIALILNVKDREIKNNQRKIYKIMQENSSNDQEIRGCEERIRNLEDMNNNRLRKLEKYSRDTFRAVQWFRENQNLFEQPVYEPMMLELQFADPYYAAHVESMVPNRDLLAFTFSCARDMNVFLRRVRAPPPGPALRAVGAVCAPPPAPAPPPEPLLR
ncbi:unnamed protein product [Euphydryas editha]|uniref:Structural maintenance of chromosomes protein 5 n=1 Tax=Euphydryas editha TaxID=104508 RepID=A0AAU9UKC8_EUPED|nr:unnamed protein product [Euphydryas editha]